MAPRSWLSAALVGCLCTAVAVGTPSRAQQPVGGGWILTARDLTSYAAPTFLGNGYLGARVPAAGMGYGAAPVSTDSQVAGFYAKLPGYAEQRADVPTWSTLALSDGSGTYGRLPSGTATCDAFPACPSTASSGQWQGSVSGWQQQLDLRRAVLTTTALWTSPAGRRTALSYDLFLDEARPGVGVVRLRFTPSWSGSARITSMFDATDTQPRAEGTGTAAAAAAVGGLLEGTDTQLALAVPGTTDADAVQTTESVTAVGTGTTLGLAAVLQVPKGTTLAPAAAAEPASVGVAATVPVTAGSTYTVTKLVGVASSSDPLDPVARARSVAREAARAGYGRLLAEHTARWAALWRSDITVPGDPQLQALARASLFYLLESTRADSPWSLSPAGLSSPGYNGHVFWDAETWMYPPLLAMHPELAAAVNGYRAARLDSARRYAASSGYAGARFPWESATNGDEQTPVFANTPTPLPGGYFPDTGQYELHITADVALAQWQYYLATGDLRWLRSKGWPVIAGAAAYWASRATPDPTGGYDLLHVMGPDEYHADVANSAYTNVAAASTLRIANRAAGLLGRPRSAVWERVAAGLLRTVPTSPAGWHPEFRGYSGDLVKQADVVMLQYPWELPMPSRVAANDLAYYAAHTDPAGPSMTDAVNAIDSAALGQPGCSSYWYLLRSTAPFVRGPFAQFAETRTGGAFTFTTAAGGFLQELLFGFAGLRWGDDEVRLAPTLPPQLPGLVLHGLSWHGRRFTLALGPRTTTLSAGSDGAIRIRVAGALHLVPAGGSLTVATRRPDLTASRDLARCRSTTATSADPSYPAMGATDGQDATSWTAAGPRATLQVDLGSVRAVDGVQLRWGSTTGTTYELAVSSDGRHWTRLGREAALGFPPVRARYVRLAIRATSTGLGAQVRELVVTGP